MTKLVTLSSVAALLSLAASSQLHASIVVDGQVSSGEYGSPVFHVNPQLQNGGNQSVDLYWSYDSSYVYGAIVGDPTKGSDFPGLNVYVYSSTASTDSHGVAGTYGDGNDVIIEGTEKWSFSQNGPVIWANDPHYFTRVTQPDGTVTSSLGGVSIAYNSQTFTEEFAISRSLLGDYDKYRYGGQLFSYEFDTGSKATLVPVDCFTAVPEPSTVIAGAMMLVPFGAAIARRLRKKQ